MAQELLLVNPRRKHRRKRRTMSALQRKYFGVRRNPRKRRRSRVAALAGPAPAHKTSRRHRRRASTGRRKSFSRRMGGMRSFSVGSFMNNTLIPAGIGAAGALGADLALKYANPYLPTFLQSGIGNTIARLGSAIAVGYVAGMALGKSRGEQALAGAVTVTLYDLLKQNVAPALGLSGFGWVSPSLQAGAGRGMGMYVGQDRGMAGLGMYVGRGRETEADYIRSY